VTDVAAERFDATVNVLMLFQPARRGEGLAAAGTLMLADTGHTRLTVGRPNLLL